MIDLAKLTRAVSRMTAAQSDAREKYARLTKLRAAMLDAEREYNVAQSELREAEAAVASAGEVNTHGIARKLTLAHARYTKSDVRV